MPFNQKACFSVTDNYIFPIKRANNDNIKAPKKAGKNPSTSKLGIILLTRRSKSAFITNVNKPRVRKFIGNDTNINTGLITAFTRASTIVTKRALVKSFTAIPGIIRAINIIESAYKNHLSKSSNIKFSLKLFFNLIIKRFLNFKLPERIYFFLAPKNNSFRRDFVKICNNLANIERK